MSRFIDLRLTAKSDIAELVDSLTERASRAFARRFYAALQKTLKLVAAQPGIGRPRDFGPQLDGLRSKQVIDFDDYLVFYRTTDDAIDVIHVVYGGRDLDVLFRDDPDPT